MRGKTIFAVTIAIAVLASACRPRNEQAEGGGDIVLVTIDTLRADATGFGGSTRVKTPFLDSLAARGTVFTHAHAHNVVTLASHTNILTGLYPWQHGIRDNAGFVLDPKYATIATLLHDAGYATGAFVSAYPLDSKFGLDRGFDVYDDGYEAVQGGLDFAVQERAGSKTLAAASQWWNANAGKKRFLWVHLYEPHAPYLPPPPFREQYRDNPYYGEVAAVDSMMAQTLAPILNSSPDALVVVTGDHGESLGEHGEQTHGLFAYESTLAVPLIVIDPSRKPSRDARYVRHIDIAPTILARAGVSAPAECKGLPLFAEGDRGYTYFEALSASINRGWAPLVGAIDGGKKLIELPLPELYDLAKDPKETRNAFRDDRRAVASLRALLAKDAPSKTNVRGNVSAEEQARLMSLGYISGTSSKTSFTQADDPKNLVGIDTQLHEAIAAYQAGDLARALEKARAIAKERPDMQLAQELLAFLMSENASPAEAIEVLQRRVASGRANDAVRIRLGLMLSEAGRAHEAIDLLRPFASGNDADVLNAYGVALADSGDAAGAVAQFDRILAADPNNSRAHQNRGIVALRSGRVPLARRELERALQLNAKLPQALNALGVVEAKSGNMNAAIERWSQAVALDRGQFDALFNLGVVAAQEGRREVARRALQDYVARAPAKFAAERKEAEEVLRTLR